MDIRNKHKNKKLSPRPFLLLNNSLSQGRTPRIQHVREALLCSRAQRSIVKPLPSHPRASHGRHPLTTALQFLSWRLHCLLARHQGDGAVLGHCRPDSFGVCLCQAAGLSEDMSGIIIALRSAGRSFPELVAGRGPPAQDTPAYFCLPAARRGGSTRDPRGQQEGQQNTPENLLKATS